jgi:ubiquinone/menaquinone biosynthesis C-methylase UbiE
MTTTNKRRRIVPEMEGLSARQYAKGRNTPSQLAEWRQQAAAVTAGLPDGARILEIAPGPGFFSVELARLGFAVSAVDLSRTMVQITTENAAAAGLAVDVQQGDAAALPFGESVFDLVVCQAAFKNFPEPVAALNEMHRVLKAGGTAVIDDLAKDATRAEIAAEVDAMGQNPVGGLFTRIVLGWLRRRAVTAAGFAELAEASAFGGATISRAGVGVQVRLVRG